MARFNEGSYEGQGRGYNGKLTLRLSLSPDREVPVAEHS